MPVPKPHDPNAPAITPDELADELAEIFSEQPEDLATQADQLERAHQVLQRGLQEK